MDRAVLSGDTHRHFLADTMNNKQHKPNRVSTNDQRLKFENKIHSILSDYEQV